jgi:hypothetical protein
MPAARYGDDRTGSREMIMARERAPGEAAQRRTMQRTQRQERSTGRPAPPGSHFTALLRGKFQIATAHPGSKRGHAHRPDVTADNALARSAAWSAATGRPLPPAARIRHDKVSNAVPMTSEMRIMHYQTARLGYSTGLLDGLTPGQLRRERHKRMRSAA